MQLRVRKAVGESVKRLLVVGISQKWKKAKLVSTIQQVSSEEGWSYGELAKVLEYVKKHLDEDLKVVM